MSGNTKIVYSSKRKKDFVTFFAIAMFCLLVLFQLYLIFIVPVQLKNKNTLELHVVKEESIGFLDNVRSKAKHSPAHGRFQNGEKQLVVDILDSFALHARAEQDRMSLEQLVFFQDTLMKYDALIGRWRTKDPKTKDLRFNIREEQFDFRDYVKKVEADAVYR